MKKRISILLAAVGSLTVGVQPASAQLQDVVDVLSVSDLNVIIGDNPDPVAVGNKLTYSIIARNNGPSAAPDVVVDSRLDPSLQFRGGDSTAACDEVSSPDGPSEIRCQVGRLEPNEDKLVKIVVRTTERGTARNQTSIRSESIDVVDLLLNNNDKVERTDVVPGCGGLDPTIVGTTGRDRLFGSSADDVIVGLAGNDRIGGGGGNDAICSGAGKDRVKGGPGRDGVSGGRSEDRIGGGLGPDFLLGNSGPDTIFGYTGNDVLNGGSGRDRCQGGPGRDRTANCERGSA